jgi:hypothetical protein
MSDHEKTFRPREILVSLGRRYPEAWKVCEEFRAAKGAGLPDWPDWCGSGKNMVWPSRP